MDPFFNSRPYWRKGKKNKHKKPKLLSMYQKLNSYIYNEAILKTI